MATGRVAATKMATGQVAATKTATSRLAANSSGPEPVDGGHVVVVAPLGSLPVVSGHLEPAANQLTPHVVNQLTTSADLATGM